MAESLAGPAARSVSWLLPDPAATAHFGHALAHSLPGAGAAPLVLYVDLYRLRDPAELDDLGLADDLAAVDEQGRVSVLLAEWPSRGAGRLPGPDLILRLALDGDGRKVSLNAGTGVGSSLLREVQRALPGGF